MGSHQQVEIPPKIQLVREDQNDKRKTMFGEVVVEFDERECRKEERKKKVESGK